MTDKLNSEQYLRAIQSILEEIRSIFVLANQDKLEEIKKRLLPKNSVKEQIYNLCDGTKSTKDIAKVVQKDSAYIRSYLSRLRREGLIRTIERGGKTIHEQII